MRDTNADGLTVDIGRSTLRQALLGGRLSNRRGSGRDRGGLSKHSGCERQNGKSELHFAACEARLEMLVLELSFGLSERLR
jgi:hypothetical protein